jgi:uncharacterized protein (TIGR02118 family)
MATAGRGGSPCTNPPPKDVEADFEEVYQDEHVPPAIANLEGMTKMVAAKILTAPDGYPRFHRIVEVYFTSMEALRRCAESAGGKATLAHATQISSGEPPVIMMTEVTVPYVLTTIKWHYAASGNSESCWARARTNRQ